MTSNPLMILGVTVLLGVAMNMLRFWTFVQGSGANRRARMSRINDHDAHLSFDERIAERMRELEREKGETTAPATHFTDPAAPTQGFGRRQA